LTAAGTASVGTALTVAGDSGSENINLLDEVLTISGGTNLTSSAASNTVTVNLDDNISLTSVVASGVVTATSGFSGNVTGNVTGNLTGNINSSGVSTVTSLNATNINASGIVTAAEFKTGSAGSAIGINTNTISGPATITIDPAAVGDNTGTVVIKGDLQVDGTTTTINSTTVTVDDLNILLADGAVNDAAANGGGFTVQSGDGNKTFQFEASGDNFGSSENVNLASGKTYKINNTEVLSATTLGSGVTNSSLTNVGTLTNLNVAGVTTSTGGFVGALTGNVTGNVYGNLIGVADTAVKLQTARDFSISGDATASAVSFNGTANVGLALTLANTGVTTGTYGSASEIPTFTVDAKGRLTSASTVNVATALTVTSDFGTETINLLNETLTVSGGTNLNSSANNNTLTVNLDNDISLTSVNASGIVTATSGFVGGLTGNVTGNIKSSGISTFATVSAANISASGIVTATSGFVGNVTGNVTGNLTGGHTGDVTGNINSSGISTLTNVNLNGYLSIGNTSGVNNYIVASTGVGVTWKNLADILPQTRTTQSNIATAGQTVFNFNYNVTYLDVFVNGVRLSSSEFTATNGTTITLAEATFANDVVEFVSYSTVIGGAGSVNTLNDLTDVNVAGASIGNLLNYNGSDWVATSTLSGITSIDSTTRATIETAVAAAPNDFTSLNITNSGISTFSGALDVNADADISGKLTVANVNASGIVTATSGFVGGVTGDVTGNIKSSGISTFATVSAANINVSGIVTATSGFVGNLTGLASSATQLATGRTVAITGDLTYTSGSFNGTGNVTGVGTLATVNSNVGSFGSQTLIPVVTVNAKGLVTAVTTAAVGTALTVTGDSGSENIDLLTESLTISGGTNLTSSAASNTVTVNLDPNISLTSIVASGVITATSGFVGNLTGNINSSGVSTVTSLNATNVNASGIVTATSGFVGGVTGNVTGNINSSGISTFATVSAANVNASGIVTAAQFVTGASGAAIGINTNTISGPATITLDPAAVGD
ncbi:S-layer family protein, partial [bacterium]|nr:S-layer family protein [bacterium]